jgi:WD40 repeat protein/serine/threonine protein kinase
MTEPSVEGDPLDALAESFVARFRRGERPSLTEYISRNPELADRIRKLFPALVVLEELGSVADPDAQRSSGLVARADPVPRELGEYLILREVGRGGMGIVYEAVQQSLGRHVALKVLPLHAFLKPAHIERFRREARAAAQLHHTNIVPVFGVGEERGIHYYAMQFIHGQGLDEVLHEVKRLRNRASTTRDASRSSLAEGLLTGNFSRESGEWRVVSAEKEKGSDSAAPPSELSHSPLTTHHSRLSSSHSDLTAQPDFQYFRSVAQLGVQIADALGYAHREGILHRDIKPSNLLLDSMGRVWITDFGLAKGEASDEITQPGDIVGTLRYMAPERLEGRADPTSDVYGLGVTLYEMLTLTPAFEDSSRALLIERITREEPPPPRRRDPHIPRDLETIVLKAMAKAPADRYASAAQFAEDLHSFLADRPIRARRISPLEQGWRWCRRNPALAATTGLAATALALVAVLGLVLAIYQHHATEQLRVEQQQTVEALTEARTHRDLADQAASRLRQEQVQTQAALKEAENQRRVAEQLTASYALDQGVNFCNQGDVASGMLWLTHSLEIAPDHVPELQRVIRANLAGWKRELCPLKALLPHRDAVLSLAFSPDGALLLTGSWDKNGRLWDAQTGVPIGPRLFHETRIFAVGFTPDSRTAVTAGGGGGAQLWDVTKHRPLGARMHRGLGIWAVGFTPDSRTLFTGDVDGKVQAWDATSGEFLRTVCAHGAPVRALALSPDGRILLTGGEDHLARFWDAATGEARKEPLRHEGFVHAVAFSHDGNRTLTGSADGFARLWDTATGKQIGLPLAHRGAVYSVAFSADDQLLLTSSADGSVRLWDAKTAKLQGLPLQHRGPTFVAAFGPKGAVATGGSENVVRLWSPSALPLAVEQQPRQRTPLDTQAWIRAVAISPSGRHLLTGGSKGAAQLWDMRSLTPIGDPIQHRDTTRAVAFSPDGTMLLTGSFDRTVRLWSAATLEPISKPLVHSDDVWAVAFSPDSKKFVTADSQGKAQIWKSPTCRPCGVSFHHPGRVNALAWSPNGTLIASAGQDGTGRRWDARTGRAVGRPLRHRDAVWSIVFSTDGRTIATGSWDGTARLWDSATGEPKGPVFQHQAKIESVALSPDGLAIVTGSLDGRAQLWDVATGKPIGPPMRHADMVVATAFHPDGRTIVTGGADRALHVWQVPPPVEGSVEEVDRETQLLTGLQLAPGGATLALDPERWSRLYTLYRTLPFYSFQVGLCPFHPEPYYQRGRVYNSLGQLEKAVEDWSVALRVHSGDTKLELQLRTARGNALVGLKRPIEAAVDFRRALELDPEQPAILNSMAWLAVMGPQPLRDAKQALRLIQRALALAPDDQNFLNTLGFIHYRLGNYREAIAVLKQSVQVDSAPAFDLFPLAMCHARLGDPKKARDCYDQAVQWLREHKGELNASWSGDLDALQQEAAIVVGTFHMP